MRRCAAMKPRYEVAIDFGENLLHYRRSAGLSQEELSFRSSVHRTDISKTERGESLPRADTLLKLAGGLVVEPQELLDGLAWEPPPVARLPCGSFRVVSTDRSQEVS